MPPPNSAKKVAKVARSTSRRGSSGPQGRSLGFPLAVAVIIALGLVLVGFGHNRRATATEVPPKLGDHWHAAYGIYICDAFRAPLNDIGEDRRGIHTHADGLMHIHPFSSGAAGKKADLSVFFEQIKLQVDDTKITFPGGKGAEVKKNGDTCPDGKAGKVKLYKWANARAEDPPVEITKDMAKTRFMADGEGYVIAFVPDGVTVPKPDSVATLANPGDVGPNSGFGPDGLPVEDTGTANTIDPATLSTAPTETTAAGSTGTTTATSAAAATPTS